MMPGLFELETKPPSEPTRTRAFRPLIQRLLTGPILAALLLLVVGLLAAGHYWLAARELEGDVRARMNLADVLFRGQIDNDTRLLDSLIDTAMENPCMVQAFAARDRDRLQACSERIFSELRAHYRVTHFYFHTPDKRVFLRVHMPQRHSDPINRHTLDEAVRTGRNSHGLEGGNIGLFTLRVVHPWHQDGRAVGYVEMGMEIDHYTRQLKDILGVDLLFVIHKQFASRIKWEDGQRMLGRQEDWDEYPNCVVIDRTTRLWLPEIDQFGQGGKMAAGPMPILHARKEGQEYLVSAFPLVDAAKLNVGNMIVIEDATGMFAGLLRETLGLALLGTLATALALAGFWFYARRLQRALALAGTEREALEAKQDSRLAELLASQDRMQREHQQCQRSLLEERLLAGLQHLALEPLPLADFLQAALARLLDGINWLPSLPEAALFLVARREGGEELELVAEYNLSPQLVSRCARVPFGHCLCGRVAASREILHVGDVDGRHDTHFDGMVPHGHYVVPMLHGKELQGVFTLYLPHGAPRDPRDEAFLARAAEILVLGIAARRGHPAEAGGHLDERI